MSPSHIYMTEEIEVCHGRDAACLVEAGEANMQ